MGNQLLLTLLYLVGITLLLIFNEAFYRKLKIRGEMTRKFAHMTATLSTTLFPFLFIDHWYILFLAVVFFVLLFVSRNTRHLRSIHDIDRFSVGSYLLPLSIYLTFLISFRIGDPFLFILPMLVLAISDPLAGFFGVSITIGNSKIRIFSRTLEKTYAGSLTFFISSLLISIIALSIRNWYLGMETFLLAVAVALVGTIVEMLSPKGSDNLSVPLSILAVLAILN